MDSLASLPDHLRGPLLQQVEQLQVQDSVKLYNELVDVCFTRCVSTFHTQTLDDGEDKCIKTCAEKYMNKSKRVGQRWQEHQAQQNEQMVQSVQSLAQQQQPPPPPGR